MKEYQGELKASSKTKVAVVISRFNGMITQQLLGGARDGFTRCGVSEDHIDIFWVPGAFELPAAGAQILKKGGYDGILFLGAVIRGSTPHFDYVAGESAKGISELSRTAGIPVIYSVLTTDSIEQALERAGTKAGNKGFDGALALIEMASLFSKIN